MHYLIKVLVEADNAEEALTKAENECDTLVERQHIDWYNMDGRWGKSEAHEAESEQGKKLIAEGIQAARRQFDEAMAAVRYMMDNYSDDDIFEERFPSYSELEGKLPEGVYSLSKWQFGRVNHNSNEPFLYSEGEVVDNQRSLASQFKYAEKQLWVVPVDAHN